MEGQNVRGVCYWFPPDQWASFISHAMRPRFADFTRMQQVIRAAQGLAVDNTQLHSAEDGSSSGGYVHDLVLQTRYGVQLPARLTHLMHDPAFNNTQAQLWKGVPGFAITFDLL
jgi:hypothetical protein